MLDARNSSAQYGRFAGEFRSLWESGTAHGEVAHHDGSLDFQSLSFYIVPGKQANLMYQEAVKVLAAKPKRDGGSRKLGNMAVHVPNDDMAGYKNAWGQLKSASKAAG